jgi:photosystem II stability/assembly factor-like uncharacterized protein
MVASLGRRSPPVLRALFGAFPAPTPTPARRWDAFGLHAAILRTTDGGATWTTQSSGTASGLVGVSCPDANTYTATGAFGMILRTTNGGATWTTQSSGTTNTVVDVSCPDANTCTAMGGLTECRASSCTQPMEASLGHLSSADLHTISGACRAPTPTLVLRWEVMAPSCEPRPVTSRFHEHG